MIDKVFLDTNVLVYAYDSGDSRKQKLAQDLIKSLFREDKATISTQVLGEFYTIVTKKIADPLNTDQAEELVELFGNLHVQAIDLEILKRAIAIHRRYLISFWDGQIIAAAERAGCRTILSEDLSSGQLYSQIEVLNPFS